MSGKPDLDSLRGNRRAIRRAETMHEIVTAAWQLCRDQGLNALAMRDLGARVGMRAQSLYGYFDSKHAIYDAMFAAGNREFLTTMQSVVDRLGSDRPRESVRLVMVEFVEFCTADPTRFELLFLRTIPGFVPSSESYAIAEQVLGVIHTTLADLGLDDVAIIDIGTAMSVGLATQQIANEPGGHHWTDLAEQAVELLLATTPLDN